MNTLTHEQVRNLTDGGLDRLAEAILFYIETLTYLPDSGLYGDPEASLHVVALEMNRRYGHACTQTVDDLDEAIGLLFTVSFPDPEVRVSVLELVRALGVVLDTASDQDWVGLELADWTRWRVQESLLRLAWMEGRTFPGRLRVWGPFFPADAVAIF